MRLPAFLRKTKPAASDAPQTAKIIRGPWRPFRKRSFQAAQQDRLTADWILGGDDINEELKRQLPIMVKRARELEQNGDHARRFLSQVQIHVVGSAGFNLQVKGTLRNGTLDVRNNKAVENAFWRWAKRGVCDVTGRFSLADIERLAMRSAARDGEYLIRIHDTQPTRRNPFGFALEILDVTRLDVNYNEDLKDGLRIRMGIGYDRTGTPILYYLRRGNDHLFALDKYEVVSADDIIHDFISERPEQQRGIPWMCSAMLRMHQLGEYEDSALTAAREGANKMGFFKGNGANAHAVADDVDENGDLIQESQAGTFSRLPNGVDFVDYDPTYPHENFEPFTRAHLRSIAMGLGVSYHGLTGDLSQVNFSSSRTGTLEERESWMVIQDWFSAGSLTRIYERWLSAALLNKQVSIKMGADEAIERFSSHLWQGRRWPWVDPMKDIEAAIAAINAGLKSPQMVAAEMGVDIEDVLDAIADFQRMAREKNITLNAYSKAQAQQQDDVIAQGKNNAES